MRESAGKGAGMGIEHVFDFQRDSGQYPEDPPPSLTMPQRMVLVLLAEGYKQYVAVLVRPEVLAVLRKLRLITDAEELTTLGAAAADLAHMDVRKPLTMEDIEAAAWPRG